jgi:hypothetical protein
MRTRLRIGMMAIYLLPCACATGGAAGRITAAEHPAAPAFTNHEKHNSAPRHEHVAHAAETGAAAADCILALVDLVSVAADAIQDLQPQPDETEIATGPAPGPTPANESAELISTMEGAVSYLNEENEDNFNPDEFVAQYVAPQSENPATAAQHLGDGAGQKLMMALIECCNVGPEISPDGQKAHCSGNADQSIDWVHAPDGWKLDGLEQIDAMR